jgi:2,4-dienoyl-CoA reductase-like NADH-dependent reductase (Old Yellow Enzyme family)
MNTSRSDPLFEPLRLKRLTLRNRIMSTSHACGLGDENHMPGEAYQLYHLEKARGGLALTMFGGSSYVAKDSLWATGQLNISTDAIIPYLLQFSERVHAEGAAIMIQITHLGRRAETNTQNWLSAIAPSVVREIGHRSIPREMDRHDIDRVVKSFGDAALRAKEGGLDGLETMTHGHLIGQFFSPVTNKRTDGFGGSLANRCRFGLLVHNEIRRRVGDDFIVGMRLGIDESAIGGSDFEECVEIARIFEAEGLLDFLNANYGRIDTELALANECMPGMAMPNAPWLERAGAFKREVRLPVFHAAKITDIATARYAIREGLLDMVAMTRAHIADPHIANKIARGEEHRIRPCVGASHCMGDQRPTCLHNPASGRERYWPHTIDRTEGPIRKIVVVGGGPAGLEAARICAERGHAVVLFEAAGALGGQLRLAEKASWRRDLASIVDWRATELEALGVDVRLNVYAEPEDVTSQEPKVVIIATGGIPDLGWLEGAEQCTSAWDIIGGSAQLGDRIVLYDGTGRHTAPIVAEQAMQAGKSLSYIMLDDVPAKELGYAERVIWKKRFAQAGIAPRGDYGLRSIEPSGNALVANFVHELTGQPLRLEADTIVVENGTHPADDIFHDLRGLSVNDGVADPDALLQGVSQPALDEEGFALFRIGDAVSSRNVAAAMFDALRLCCRM